MTLKLEGNKIIWWLWGILVAISFLEVYSSIGTLAYRFHDGNTSYYFFRQGIFVFLSAVVIYITHKIDYKIYMNISKALYAIALMLLLLTFFVGLTKNGASRWINIFGVSFQPSDFAKIAAIFTAAKILTKNADKVFSINSFKNPVLIELLFALTPLVILILPSNFSTAILVSLVIIIMIWIAGADTAFIGKIFFFGALASIIFVIIAGNTGLFRGATWLNRILSFFSHEQSSQLIQSKLAIAQGGFFGVGPGGGTQRTVLSQAYSDFIYAIIVEEFGFIGGFIIISIYIALFVQVFRLVKKVNKAFPALVAMGFTLLILIQAFMHIAVTTGLMPVTGQPLPLVSMGGTSMIFTSFMIGVILNISKTFDKQRNV